MDGLEELYSSFKVDDRPNNPAAVHPMFSEYYKHKGDTSNQAARRKEFLESQKRKRKNLHNAARNVPEVTESVKRQDNCVTHKKIEEMQNVLMESEWLVDVPEDLPSWTSVICPEGKRCVLVSSGRSTIAYDKRGRKFLSFPSWLPNGSHAETKNRGKKSHQTTLDCIYCFPSKTFYILDVIAWNALSLLNCETDFRFYWLDSKISELPELSVKSKVNPYAIKLAMRFPTSELPTRMSHHPLTEDPDVKIDGVLFYHGQTDYTPGPTPLVGWLKPFMISEILGISTHVDFSLDYPANYKTALEFIKHFNETKKGKEKFKSKKKNPKMPNSETFLGVSESMDAEVSVNCHSESTDEGTEEKMVSSFSAKSHAKSYHRPSSPAEGDDQMPPTKKCLVETEEEAKAV